MINFLDDLHIELFEALEVPLAINDMQGNLLYVNQRYAELIGYSKSEVYKLSCWDITPEKYNPQEQEQLKSLAEIKKYGPYDKEYIHRDGSLIPVRLNGKIIELNGMEYIWSSIEDISYSVSKAVSSDLESKSRLIEDSINEIFIFDYHTLKFLYTNNEARKNIGYSEEELLKMTPLDIKPEINEEKFREIIQPLIENKTDKISFETIHKRKDGSTYCVEIRLQKGNFEGHSVFIAYIWDNTEKKMFEIQQNKLLESLNEALQFQEIIQENSGYAIIASDLEGTIVTFNKAAENILGYSAQEMINKQTPAIFHDFDEVVKRSEEFSKILGRKIVPGFHTFVCLTDHGLQNFYEWTYIRKDGTRFPVSLYITSLKNKDGIVTGYMGMARDISESKQKEKELIDSRNIAEKALAVKTEFLANMSHEIRTPMNGIVGMTEILLSENLDQQILDDLMVIKESSDALLEIINNILDLSKIEAEKMILDIVEFDLKMLIKNCITLHKASIKNKEISIDLDIKEDVPSFVLADKIKIEQVVNNLLNNAVKFTHQGHVKVFLSAHDFNQNECKISISVADSGIGINEENKLKIFESFTQEDGSTTRRFGGTGLGLSICKKLMNLMDGEISVENLPKGGAEFKIELRVKYLDKLSAKVPTSTIKRDKKADKSGNILVVEDNEINRKVVCSMLTKMGHHFEIASNGLEAIEKLKEQSFKLILMDCHMPILDGFMATTKIIELYGENRPVIIALTASAMPEDIQRCFKIGMDDFLSKPINHQKLKFILAKYAEKKTA